jgi:hypothetical protein
MAHPIQTIIDRTRLGWMHVTGQLSRVLVLGLLFLGLSLGIAGPAQALIPVKLTDVTTQECPPELAKGMVTSGGLSLPAHCYLVVGKADNNSGKVIFDADIFGRIYDADNNSVLENRTRLGMIDKLEPGISDFAIRISVAESQAQAGPLKLKQFKASGFANSSRIGQSAMTEEDDAEDE